MVAQWFSGSDDGLNFYWFGGGHNWDEPSSSLLDPTLIVYQVLLGIMHTLHFVFKKIVLIVEARLIVDSDKEKVPAILALIRWYVPF